MPLFSKITRRRQLRLQNMNPVVSEEEKKDKDKDKDEKSVGNETEKAAPADSALLNAPSNRQSTSRKSIRSSQQRSSRVPHLCGPTVAVLPCKGLDALITADYQKRLLLLSWKRLQTKNNGRRIQVLMEEVIERLLLRRPETRNPFFYRTALCVFSGNMRLASIRNHAAFIVDAIHHIIDDLIAPPTNRALRFQHISNIGHNHRFLEPYGLESTMWESFGTAFIDVIATQDAIRDLPGSSRLWIIVAASLVDMLRAGFEKAPSSKDNGSNTLDVQSHPCVFSRRSRSFTDQLAANGMPRKSPSPPPVSPRRLKSTSPNAGRRNAKKRDNECFNMEHRRSSNHDKMFCLSSIAGD